MNASDGENPHQITTMVEDLKASGLTVADLGARNIDSPERAATRTGASISGYVIPYFNIFGKPLTHYRVKLFNDPQAKYRQPKESSTYVYFPKNFMQITRIKHSFNKKVGDVIFVTEGEKKAALACRMGLPTVGLGGVDAWRNRVIQLAEDPKLTKKGKNTVAKVESGTDVQEATSSLAVGMQDLLDYVLHVEATVVIVFDSDVITGVQPGVQKAAATLGFELRARGVPFARIRQLILPIPDQSMVDSEGKLGLDDYLLMDEGFETFQSLVSQCLQKESAFPRHPAIMDYVGRKLQKRNLSRKECQGIALAILSDLDATGQRLKDADAKRMYYFDNASKNLMEAGFLYGQSDEGHESPFGGLLYRRYGLSVADQKVLTWLSAQFYGELPVKNVSPERVLAKARNGEQPDLVRYQISDGQFVTVTADDIQISDNGYEGVLFECGHVLPIDKADLIREYRKRSKEPVLNWWATALEDTRIKDMGYTRKIHSLLYYLSPWLNRWRGMQLPIELALGESGSGKSTLYSLRLSILTGDSRLRNSPSDLKDWYASVVNAGGLHVIDNVQLSDVMLRQKLSDELCRIVTEPRPFVEQRQYYTNVGMVKFAVKPTFALTAIKQPFTNADLMQRAFILELNRPATGDTTMFDMDWTKNKLDVVGGRVAWIAHHLHVIQQFFKLVKTDWNPSYRAVHRLVHLEQSLILMAKVFGMDYEWIPGFLVGTVENQIIATDWAFEGVSAFVIERRAMLDMDLDKEAYVLASDIVEWAVGNEEYGECEILKSNRKLGRWMNEHRSMLAQAVGLVPAGMYANRQRYQVIRSKKFDKDKANAANKNNKEA